MLVISLLLLGCSDPKIKIIQRQKEILKEKNVIDEKLNAAKDSSMPSSMQLKEWDSLYNVENALNSEYDSLQKELKKY